MNELQNEVNTEINSFPFVVFGTISFIVSCLFFNGGSVLTMFAPRTNGSAKIMMNTVISSTSAGLVAAFLKPLIMGTYTQHHRYDVNALTNGILAGLVSIAGVCDRCEPWSAFLIGVIGSPQN